MRYLLFSFLFVSCSQKTLFYNRADHSKQISLFAKKNGEYRALVLHYKLDDNTQFHFIINKSICDSFVLHRLIKVSRKSKDNYRIYILSKNGSILPGLSPVELNLIAEFKNTVDSLGWCQSKLLEIPEKLFATEIKRK